MTEMENQQTRTYKPKFKLALVLNTANRFLPDKCIYRAGTCIKLTAIAVVYRLLLNRKVINTAVICNICHVNGKCPNRVS